ALDPLRRERRACNRRTAAEGLELRFFNHLRLRVHADLQAHDVAALRRTHQPRAHFLCALVERAYVARIVVVVDYPIAVCHESQSPPAGKPQPFRSFDSAGYAADASNFSLWRPAS